MLQVHYTNFINIFFRVPNVQNYFKKSYQRYLAVALNCGLTSKVLKWINISIIKPSLAIASLLLLSLEYIVQTISIN